MKTRRAYLHPWVPDGGFLLSRYVLQNALSFIGGEVPTVDIDLQDPVVFRPNFVYAAHKGASFASYFVDANSLAEKEPSFNSPRIY